MQGGDVSQERFILDVLKIMADHELQDSLWWTVKDDTVKFMVNCNDLFYWATADAEEVTPENLQALWQAIMDCKAVEPEYGADEPSLSRYIFSSSSFTTVQLCLINKSIMQYLLLKSFIAGSL